MGEGYDPSQIWEMQVTLNDVADPDRSRAVVLSAGDPALEEALSILNGASGIVPSTTGER